MNLLETLTRAADEQQLRLHPLPEHAAAKQAEHLRQHYALLLAAVLTAQPAVSEPQTRLLRLLLDALKLGDIRGSLFEKARELEPEPLLETARLIREAGFSHHLVVDTLVLLRLDAPLSDEAARLAGELAAFFGLDETELATRVGDVSEILGLNVNEAGSGVRDADEKDDNKDKADKFAIERISLAEYWPGRLRQSLSIEALRAGLQGGLWVLDADLAVHFPWQANDAVLFFRNGTVLNTFAESGEIRLENCRLVDAALTFQSKGSITLQRCDWQGDYDPAAKHTALDSNGQAVTITDCRFSTRNARTITVQNNTLTLTGSRFNRCGHAELGGGAIYHSDHSRTIEDCYFDRCIASYGGAIFVNFLYGINQCEFVACESRGLQDKGAGDIAVYAIKAKAPEAISNCSFRQTSLAIGDAYDGIGAFFVRSTQFQKASIFFHNKDYRNQITSSCRFVDGREIDRNLAP